MATTAAPQLVRVAGGQQGQLVDTAQDVVPPDLSRPLIDEPAQANPPAASDDSLGPLHYLLGTWTNRAVGTSGRGGPDNPFSYNLMALPQASDADPSDPKESPFGYILKSMSYYEEITFTAVHGAAANRGGAGTQVSNAILYEQRVYISDGPAKDMLVHFENGIWGYLTPAKQVLGPYGNGDKDGLGNGTFGEEPPVLDFNIFKQISVPHGNSVLACGVVPVTTTPTPGAPTIAPPPQVLPSGIDTGIYHPPGTVQNLSPQYALNPNLPLSEALAAGPVKQFIELNVSSEVGGGKIANIDFEQQRSDVTQYQATYWIEDTGDGQFDQLQYSQTILLEIPITLPGAPGPVNVAFPHITSNTLTRVTPLQ